MPVFLLFGLCLAFNLWGVSVGWKSQRLPGQEFRQVQTAVTALFVQQEGNFSLAYPTPVLGKPWSIPFEFPLYQWTVVVVSNATGMQLIQTGRTVSVGCFYLALPAVWLLLGRIGAARPARWVVLCVVLTCPLYIFYARAFLIETMALMFSLWFLWSFVQAVERRSVTWMVAANTAGSMAGLVKVTTFFIWGVAAGVCALVWLWRARTTGWPRLARLAGWCAATVAVPCAVAWAWLQYSDRLKALNPGSVQWLSPSLREYVFGTWQIRLDPEIWASHWRIQVTNVAPGPVLAVMGVLALWVARRWWGWIGTCLLAYGLVQLLFPILYAWHEYYYVAIAVLLLVAMGLVLGGLLESKWPRGVVWAAIAGLLCAQAACYYHGLYPIQKPVLPGGDGVTELLREVTDPDDVVIIVGEDWFARRPLYAQRRALMIRLYLDTDRDYLRRAFQAQGGEKVRVLLLRRVHQDNRDLRELVRNHFGIETEPVASTDDTLICVHPALRSRFEERLRYFPHHGVMLAAPPPTADAARAPIPLTALSAAQQEVFSGVAAPLPVRFFASFGLSRVDLVDRSVLFAHPDTQLWFAAVPGRRRISAEYGIFAGAYENLAPGVGTDGVEFTIERIGANGAKETIFHRLLVPLDREADRPLQKLELAVEFTQGDELLFSTGPGPQKVANRDWAYWAKIKIQ